MEKKLRNKKVEVDLQLIDETSRDLQTALRYEHDNITEKVRWERDIYPHNRDYPKHLKNSMAEYFEINVRWHKLREVIISAEREAEREAQREES